MKIIGDENEIKFEESLKTYNYQNLVYFNPETICAATAHNLTVHNHSTRSDENCRSYLETKSSLKNLVYCHIVTTCPVSPHGLSRSFNVI